MACSLSLKWLFPAKNMEINPKNGQRKAKVEYIFISDAKDASGLLKKILQSQSTLNRRIN
jgi:hypothetical protein